MAKAFDPFRLAPKIRAWLDASGATFNGPADATFEQARQAFEEASGYSVDSPTFRRAVLLAKDCLHQNSNGVLITLPFGA